MRTPEPAADVPSVRPLLARRALLRLIGGAVAAALVPGALAGSRTDPRFVQSRSDHPEPRPGIDGSRVLTAEQLEDTPDVVDLFDGMRQIPHFADGIRCYCGCAELEGYRSLLSCYEGAGMARWCEICQGQGRLAWRRFREGENLSQIRRAIDARYGHGAPPTAQRRSSTHHCNG
jgi:hypothetical protein